MATYTQNNTASGSSGKSVNQSTSQSTSTSTPSAIQTPQSDYELQLAQILQGIGQQQYGWAQGQFNNAAGVTDQQINNYLTNAGNSTYAANNLWGRYQNTYEPLANTYIQEAGSYASTPRINFNMGQAESGAGQAATQGQNNEIEQLMSYGVNPSSGMYGELTAATNAARAASQASAGQQAEVTTQQTGRQMLQNAIAQGAQLPGASVNESNAALEGISGAENSELGLSNAGATLMDSANPFFSDAMNLKYPGIGNTSNTNSQSQSTGTSNNVSGSAGASSGESGGGSGGSGGGGNSAGGGGTSYTGTPAGGGYQSIGGTPTTVTTSGDFSGLGGAPAGGGNASNGSGGYAPSWMAANSVGDVSDGSTDVPDYSSGGFASGGVIPDSTTGGHVPLNASPSHGQQTDDVPARLNADEFVIPRDVVHWKGKEFFEKLIQQSRKARGAPQQPVGGQMKPPLSGPPRFVSRPMGRVA